jgi:hypothetical protein
VEFLRVAKELGKIRHPATIRYWLTDSSQIGPREKDDLILIALITGDKRLEQDVEEVRLAIERLWSTHQVAGNRLRDALLTRLPQVLGKVEENGTRVELGDLGAAWIGEIESIALATELRAPNEINRLLRDRAAGETNKV